MVRKKKFGFRIQKRSFEVSPQIRNPNFEISYGPAGRGNGFRGSFSSLFAA